MAGLNKVMIIGNLGKDPEMRYTPSGSPVTNFSVAVTRRWKTPDGEQKEETEWFDVECWNKLAEIANTYLSKGRQVYVEGRLRTDSWEDQQTGQRRYRTRVHALEMQMLGSRGEQTEGGQYGDRAPAATQETDFDSMPF